MDKTQEKPPISNAIEASTSTDPNQEAGFIEKIRNSASSFTHNDNFKRFLRFGLVDQSLLLLGILTGFSLDSFFARRLGVRGFGPIVGAGVGNAVADCIASLPEGKHAAIGIAAGTMTPMVPIFVAMFMRKDFGHAASKYMAGFSAAIVGGSFAFTYLDRRRQRKLEAQLKQQQTLQDM
eukprot:TRINITY_DN13607_c0_g1_i1.p1 TRINITY_DN13607_c0_g1~~TRINITY_DN13607_c0_g1_i1.p1  ORF type:complete len:179 (+),score=20.16 TRINITY_DN13607_c0_g1_i1:33-569(+)